MLLPARSRLYSIRPEGVGTARVESLTSYIQRLAGAHGVATRALVSVEILPRCESQYLARQEKADGTTWRRALGINGMGD